MLQTHEENGKISLTSPNWNHCINDLTYYRIVHRSHWSEKVIFTKDSKGCFQWFDYDSGKKLEEKKELAGLRKLIENEMKRT